MPTYKQGIRLREAFGVSQSWKALTAVVKARKRIVRRSGFEESWQAVGVMRCCQRSRQRSDARWQYRNHSICTSGSAPGIIFGDGRVDDYRRERRLSAGPVADTVFWGGKIGGRNGC